MLHTKTCFKNFPKEPTILEDYSRYWITHELLSQNKNRIPLSELQTKIDEYTGGLFKAEDVIKYFEVADDVLFSPFQDKSYANLLKRKAEQKDINELKRELEQAKALIKRLEDKIEFLKNPKPLLKKRNIT